MRTITIGSAPKKQITVSCPVPNVVTVVTRQKKLVTINRYSDGKPGAKGDVGAQGIQGLKGDRGDDGAQGIQGLKGDKGDDGAQGIQGLKGDKGDVGAQGIQGLKGDKGDPVVDYEKYFFYDKTLTAAVTNVTSEAILRVTPVPGGTFAANSYAEMLDLVNKIGSGGSANIRFYLNTSPTLLGATNLGAYNIVAGQIYTRYRRLFSFTGTALEVVVTTTVDNATTSTFNIGSVPYIVGNGYYFITAITPTSSADSFVGREFYIKGKK